MAQTEKQRLAQKRTTQRDLIEAGFVYVTGYIDESDVAKHKRLVDRAAPEVARIKGDGT